MIVHELIHCFDLSHRKWDFSDPRKLACSEIRAAREAECHDKFFSDLLPFFKKHCAKKAAAASTINLSPIDGPKCIEEMFEECFNDYEPLGKNTKSL